MGPWLLAFKFRIKTFSEKEALNPLPDDTILDYFKLNQHCRQHFKVHLKLKTKCVCETQIPPKRPFLRNVTFIFDLDLCR